MLSPLVITGSVSLEEKWSGKIIEGQTVTESFYAAVHSIHTECDFWTDSKYWYSRELAHGPAMAVVRLPDRWFDALCFI